MWLLEANPVVELSIQVVKSGTARTVTKASYVTMRPAILLLVLT